MTCVLRRFERTYVSIFWVTEFGAVWCWSGWRGIDVSVVWQMKEMWPIKFLGGENSEAVLSSETSDHTSTTRHRTPKEDQ